jgi:1-deoxy-D-xylulose-5-phosphate synthase
VAQFALLEKINSPVDLRALPEDSLPQLCEELRAYLLEVVSGIGGHLSSSLGVVELTVALHYTLDTPKDQLVWDVGHQAYIHKILTGRREQLKTIRQYEGISGFLKRSESEYDVYGAGHASTALSAAYGMAVARDIKGESTRAAAVFGDGALTGGLCYEALNNAGGDHHRRFLAILNDNQMSISPNVGAIHRYLNNFVQTPLYQRFRRRVREGLERIPRVGKPMTFLARRIEEGAKGIITPGALFEALGFDYYGPVDGHDVRELVKTLRNLRDLDHPVLLHVLTVKGKGYARAEESPEGYHGVKPFCPEEGILPSVQSSQIAFQDAFGTCMVQLAAKDPRLVGITAAMPTGTGIVPFSAAFPERFFDVGIAEEHATVFAAGLASQGLRPVCAIYSTFLQRAYDPIVHDVALQHLPVIFCMDRSGLAGEDGPTHHGAFDLAYLRHIPGIVVAAPKDGNELRDLMATALLYDKGPFAIRYPKASAEPFTPGAEPQILPVGQWEVVRPGSDAVILAVGPMVAEALKAAQTLNDQGLSVEVVNCRFVNPLDEDYLGARIPAMGAVVTIEEGVLKGGFGTAVLEWKEARSLAPPLFSMGLPDAYVQHGPRGRLLQDLGLTSEGILRLFKEKAIKPVARRGSGRAAFR